MQKTILIISISCALLWLASCDPDSANEKPPISESTVTSQPVMRENGNAIFPQDVTEIVLPFPAEASSQQEITLPYTEGLIPRPGDKVIIENNLEGAWKEASSAHVTGVTDENIQLRSHGENTFGATRVKILAKPLHRCDLQAASPLDVNAIVTGVEFEDIPISAIETCSNAASKYAGTARFHFQLGRALDAHKQEKPAFARYRYALAVDPDYATAMLALAGKYMNGEGVARDVDEAMALLQKAHGSGLIRATFLLGQIHELGIRGVEADIDSAISYYQLAGQAGDLPAQLRLADFYESGSANPDLSLALDWYERAAAQGHMDSQMRMGRAYSLGDGRAQDWQQARAWWEKAALQGLAAAQIALAESYEQGAGLAAAEPDKAMYWYRQAADQGDAMGQYHLGRMYAQGIGMDVDMDTARPWLLLAREQGIMMANRWLEPEVTDLPEDAETVSDAPAVQKKPARRHERLADMKHWHIQTQGFMDADCREALVEELADLEISVVPLSQSADVVMVITMNDPEYYSGSMGPFRFTGFNIHYRAEVIRKRDNIRLFYVHGEEDGDDRSESCVDAVDEIMDELDDELD